MMIKEMFGFDFLLMYKQVVNCFDLTRKEVKMIIEAKVGCFASSVICPTISTPSPSFCGPL